ncbi:MAG: hypothetical protein LC778_06235 [Acidobacteria bacterium]|nr:hypothetical protein [Acidobacteriota bacterium]
MQCARHLTPFLVSADGARVARGDAPEPIGCVVWLVIWNEAVARAGGVAHLEHKRQPSLLSDKMR